jgi:hypothetical protein
MREENTSSGNRSGYVTSIWIWDHVEHDHFKVILAITPGRLLHCSSFPAKKLGRLNSTLRAAADEADVDRSLKQFRRFPWKKVPVKGIRAAEFLTLLMQYQIRIRYSEGPREKTVRLKLKNGDDNADKIFNELKGRFAPDSPIQETEMSTSTAARGPVLTICITAVCAGLLAFASTAENLTWREKHIVFYRILGSLIRFPGPVGWIIIGSIVIISATLFLRRRIRNRPVVRIWETPR